MRSAQVQLDDNSEAPPEPQPTEGIYPCYLADPPDWCEEEPPPFWHPEVSATGWDEWDQWNNDNVGGGGGQGFAPSTTVLRPTEQPPVVITTRTPTVVEIRTSVEPSGTDAVGESGATRVPAGTSTDQDWHSEPTEFGQIRRTRMLNTSKYGEALSVLDSHGHTVAIRVSQDATGLYTWVDGRWLTREQVCQLAGKYRGELPVRPAATVAA